MQSELLTATDTSASVRLPFWFGPPGRRAFGWYHSPEGDSRASGVALCPSFGHEMQCAHRAYRHLADRLAARGFGVLRFDYHGTGDSPGSDEDEGRVAAWLGTIDDAIDVLRDAGFSKVVLVGTRLGATLAAVAAARRGDIDALALLAPSLTGSAFLRELRAMQCVRDRDEARPFPGQREGDEELNGFVLRRETVASLESLDLRALESKPARRAIVVPRDDIIGREERLVDRLRSLGTEVDLVPTKGWTALAATDPYFAKIPGAIWTAMSNWLEAHAPRNGRARRPPPLTDTSVQVDEHVVESVVRFGPGNRLFGIVSESNRGRGGVGIVFSNTGANTRVGPNRFNVALARQLAARGHGVLRIDLAGLGDSPSNDEGSENELYAMHSVDDVRAAVDALTGRGFRRFLAMGLCSGAFMSFHAALADTRIGGAILMNPEVFEAAPGRAAEQSLHSSSESHRSIRHYKERARKLDTWVRALRGEVRATAIAGAVASHVAAHTKGFAQRGALRLGLGELMMSDLTRNFAQLARRRARVMLLFSDEEPMLDEIERHLVGVSDWLEARGLELARVHHADHVFAPVWSQYEAADRVTNFVERFAKEKP